MIWSYFLIILLAIILGYLFGSINFSSIIAKSKNINIHEVGSKNAGASNIARTLGKKWGIIVFILDMLKTIISIVIVWMIAEFGLNRNFCSSNFNYKNIVYITGTFTIIGHIFPIYQKFKNGGKGVSCSIGFYFMCSPFLGLLSLLIIFISLKITKKSSLGSIICSSIMPFMVLVIGINYLFILNLNINYFKLDTLNYFYNSLFPFSIALINSSLVIWRHKKNIKNLIQKKELELV